MAGNSKNPPVVSPDDQADHLQKLIRERFEIITNFADVAKQAQALAKIFQTYDEDKSGSLEFEEFDRVLADIRCNQAPEPTRRALFDRYDADLDGNVNLQELMDGVFELKPHPLAKKENRKMLADIRGQITRRGGMNGIRSLGRIFKIMDDTGNGKISHEEFLYGLHDMGVDIPKSEVAIACAGSSTRGASPSSSSPGTCSTRPTTAWCPCRTSCTCTTSRSTRMSWTAR
jgi:Ca2+-binding EF-hand superfamily protein